MHTLIIILNFLLIVTMSPLQSMTRGITFSAIELELGFCSLDDLHTYKAREAEEYNQQHEFIKLLSNAFDPILSNCHEHIIFDRWRPKEDPRYLELVDSIKNFMRLRRTCKHFNRLLTPERIGNLCKHYDQRNKDWALRRLMQKGFYAVRRQPFWILVCAGADPNTVCGRMSILNRVMDEDDLDFVKVLLQHGANPNVGNSYNYPAFLDAKSRKMVKICIAHKKIKLRRTLFNGNCLLHVLAMGVEPYNAVNNLVNKGELLLDVIPDLINTVNDDGQTPLDIAKNSLKEAKKYEYILSRTPPEEFEKLMVLFKKHGGVTAKELKR